MSETHNNKVDMTTIAVRIGDKDTGRKHSVRVSLRYAANVTFAHAAFRAADSDRYDLEGEDRAALRSEAADALRDEREEARRLLRDSMTQRDGESDSDRAVRRAATLRVALRGSRIG